jgi:HD-GYP domain-containing protein (c-di-GMP phosphodiesterase class II)
VNQQTDRIELKREDITLGKPLLWNIYRSDGNVMLKKGLRITSEKNLERLMESQLFRDPSNEDSTEQSKPAATETKPENEATVSEETKKPENPFEWINHFSTQLKKILDNISDGKTEGHAQTVKLAENISKLSSSYRDQFLAAVHMYYPQAYSLMQPVYSAMLCDLTGQALGYSEEQRLSLRAAALTANLGMYSYQDALNNQTSPFTDAQREEMQLHPYQSVQMLKDVDIEDETWLKAIAQHHECNDGTGYPAGITSNTIGAESKIISLADSYMAMITRRAYGEKIQPKVALQNIYKSASAEDQSIFLAFIKMLGIFPPGTYVKLSNDEIAIVKKQSDKGGLSCIVSSISKSDLRLFNIPVERDTSEDEFSIEEFYTPTEKIDLDPLTLWGYK